MNGYVANEMASAKEEEYEKPRESFSDGGPMERWSSRSTIRFVKLYGMYPCLWDQTQPSYKNRLARDEAVQAIVDGMGLEGFDIPACRRKIRIIRSTYWNECAKISRSAANGTRYIPKLVWFPMANQFLSRISGFKEEQGWKTGSNPLSPSHRDLLNTYDSELPGLDAIQEIEVQSQEAQFASSHQNDFHGPMVKIEPEPEESDLIIEEMSGPVFSERRDDDEFEVFGKSVACQLKQLPLQDALQLQVQIQTLIAKQRMRHLQQPRQQPSAVAGTATSTFPNAYGECRFTL